MNTSTKTGAFLLVAWILTSGCTRWAGIESAKARLECGQSKSQVKDLASELDVRFVDDLEYLPAKLGEKLHWLDLEFISDCLVSYQELRWVFSTHVEEATKVQLCTEADPSKPRASRDSS